MPLAVKKSYIFWFMFMACWSTSSMKKKINESSAYLTTGMRCLTPPEIMTQVPLAMSASLR